jgi:hypothetical protein
MRKTKHQPNICGLSKGDIHEKPATIIHHGGDIAAWCWRRFGARHEERRGARRAPAAQQNAPAEKVAPALKSGQRKAPETTGQAAEPESDKKQLKTQKMDKGAPAAPAAKGSSDADGNANVRSKSTSESGAGAASSPNKSAERRQTQHHRSGRSGGRCQPHVRAAYENHRHHQTAQGGTDAA